MAKKKTTTDHGFENVENVLSKTEKYIEENQKSLTIIVIIIALIIGGYLGYKKLYLAPTEIEAQSEMYVAEQYFEKDSFLLALEGDGSYLGFIDMQGVLFAPRPYPVGTGRQVNDPAPGITAIVNGLLDLGTDIR